MPSKRECYQKKIMGGGVNMLDSIDKLCIVNICSLQAEMISAIILIQNFRTLITYFFRYYIDVELLFRETLGSAQRYGYDLPRKNESLGFQFSVSTSSFKKPKTMDLPISRIQSVHTLTLHLSRDISFELIQFQHLSKGQE